MWGLKCSLYSRPLQNGDRIQTHANSSDLKTELYLTVYVRFGFFFLFVCMYGFNFGTVNILKNVIVLFSKCWPPTVVSHALSLSLSLCYSLLNMFVTVAVINVKLLAGWGYVAFLHVSILCTVSYTLWTWVWARLRPSKWIKPPPFFACAWMWG